MPSKSIYGRLQSLILLHCENVLLNVGIRNFLTSFCYIAQVESKKDAMSVALKRFCLDPRNPVTVIRGLCEALKIGMYVTYSRVPNKPGG